MAKPRDSLQVHIKMVPTQDAAKRYALILGILRQAADRLDRAEGQQRRDDCEIDAADDTTEQRDTA